MSIKVRRKAWGKWPMSVWEFDSGGHTARRAFLEGIWRELVESGYGDCDWSWNCYKQTVGYIVVGSADL